jgi:hypothetical protein
MAHTLSEDLKRWRADRPDEWKMDEFIRKAEAMEKSINYIKNSYWEDPAEAICNIRKTINLLDDK